MSPLPKLGLQESPLNASMDLLDSEAGTNKKLLDLPSETSQKKEFATK